MDNIRIKINEGNLKQREYRKIKVTLSNMYDKTQNSSTRAERSGDKIPETKTLYVISENGKVTRSLAEVFSGPTYNVQKETSTPVKVMNFE